jgi:hypothetical protein
MVAAPTEAAKSVRDPEGRLGCQVVRYFSIAGIVIVLAEIIFQVRWAIEQAPLLRAHITCTVLEIAEGASTWCAAAVDNPPDRMQLEWNLDGGCLPPRSEEITIRVTALAIAPHDRCRLHLQVSDGLTKRLLRDAEIEIVIKRKQDAQNADPPLKTSPKAQPNVGSPGKGAGPGTAPAVSLEVSGWPDPNSDLRYKADSDVIRGHVSGLDPKHYRVLLLTRRKDGRWAAKGPNDINSDGSWEGIIDFGADYAVLVVRDSFTPPEELRQLPTVGGDVALIKRSN